MNKKDEQQGSNTYIVLLILVLSTRSQIKSARVRSYQRYRHLLAIDIQKLTSQNTDPKDGDKASKDDGQLHAERMEVRVNETKEVVLI